MRSSTQSTVLFCWDKTRRTILEHHVIDQRSLAMARIIAKRVSENPKLLDVARMNLDRWLTSSSPNSQSTLLEWKTILQSGIDEVLETLRGTDERCTRLRQSSPFAGEEFITRLERTEIIQRFAYSKV